jgi:hypothetical protein
MLHHCVVQTDARYFQPFEYRTSNGCKTITGSVFHSGC